MKKTLIALVGLVALLPTHLCAQIERANAGELLQACTDKSGGAKAAECSTYMDGLMDGLALSGSAAQFKMPICPPRDGSKRQEIRAALLDWLRSHPQTWKSPGGVAIGLALPELYPCTK